jgi:hypothetical protein
MNREGGGRTESKNRKKEERDHKRRVAFFLGFCG